MEHIAIVVIVWFFAAGQGPQIGKLEVDASLADCQAFVATEVAKQEADPKVRYSEGHCYVEGNKA